MADTATITEQPTPQSIAVPRILVFFDYACQFCYLDWPRFKRLRHEHEVELFLVPYELRPHMPEEGLPISEVGGGHSANVEEHMHRMAREGGLQLTMPKFVPHTHLALVLGELSRDIGPEAHEAVHEAIFEAYNARAENIGDRSVLLRIAEDRAIDPHELESAWDEGTYDRRLHQFMHLALAMGISATPSALICNELFIGSRPYRVLEESLERCLVTEDKLEVGAQTVQRAHVAREDGDAETREEAQMRTPAEGEPPAIER